MTAAGHLAGRKPPQQQVLNNTLSPLPAFPPLYGPSPSAPSLWSLIDRPARSLSSHLLTPDTHVMWLLPQLSRILKFFIKKNLKIARARAYNLTVTSRRKPAEFWSKGYYEEWAVPPQPTPEQARMWSARKQSKPWVSWMLWWPSQMLIKQCRCDGGVSSGL